MRNSELYRNSGILIDEQWVHNIDEQSSDDLSSNDALLDESQIDVDLEQANSDQNQEIGYESDHFSEIDEQELCS